MKAFVSPVPTGPLAPASPCGRSASVKALSVFSRSIRPISIRLPSSVAVSCGGRNFLICPAALVNVRGFQRDRKRVAWGKSVSVRVDLGGRRILEKKNRQERKGYRKY